MNIKWLSAAASLLMLCSCNYVAADPENLLHPPMLNRQQEEVYAALEDVLVLSDIRYKYPQRGEYRSPFVFYDMDGDGLLEAIVFYADQSDLEHTRVKILRQDEQGVWTNFHDFFLACDQVDFVQFGHLLSRDSFCMMIGGQQANGQSSWRTENILGIYSLGDGRFSTEIAGQRYLDYTLYDFNGDGLDEIAAVEQDPQTLDLHLSLLRAVGQHIDVVDSLPLSPAADQLVRITPGALWDGHYAVYIDESRTDGQWATEIIRVDEQGLTPLVSDTQAADDGGNGYTDSGYAMTLREAGMPCGDVDGDGDVDIPGADLALPETSADEGDGQPVGLTPLMRLTGNGLDAADYAAVNRAEGYLLVFPEKWMGWVSVVRDDQAGRWQFFLSDPDTADPAIELLRIQAYTDPNTDLSAEQGWIALGSRGTRQFAGYIPLTTEDTPSMTEDELKEMFHVFS